MYPNDTKGKWTTKKRNAKNTNRKANAKHTNRMSLIGDETNSTANGKKRTFIFIEQTNVYHSMNVQT